MSITIPYYHPELKKDSWFDNRSIITVPLGIEVLDYRYHKKGELVIPCWSSLDAPAIATFDSVGTKNLIVNDHRPEIEKIYGKPADQLTPPEGYEFTGEFRVPVNGEPYSGMPGNLTVKPYVCKYDRAAGEKRLILRPIAKAEPIQEELFPKNELKGVLVEADHNAQSIREKYAPEVLTTFYGSAADRILDYPGYVYTGELRHVNHGEWYLSTTGPRKNVANCTLTGIYLILRNLIPELPKRIVYTLTPDVEFEDGEARFLPAREENLDFEGEMILTDREYEPSTCYYRRTEEN